MSKKRNDRKAERRAAAEERLAAWAEKAANQQLKLLKFRAGKATKQSDKLRAKL